MTGDGTDAREQVDGGLKGPGEEASAADVSLVGDVHVVMLGSVVLFARSTALETKRMSECASWANFIKVDTYPVKNKLPILAPEKSKLDEGRRRFTISYATTFNMDRTSSFFAVEMFVHSACSASIICNHSSLAEECSLGNLWLKKVLIAAFSLSS